MVENRLPPLPEGAASPPLAGKPILVAVEGTDRLERILVGHQLTFAADVEEAK